MKPGGKLGLILRRLAQAVPALVGIVVVTFVLTRALPGDPAAYFAGPAATPETIREVRHNLGLDRSLPVQFLAYVDNLAHGDLGQSISTGRSVATELMARLPASLELTSFALLIATAVAVPLGILAAARPDTWIDHLCRFVVTAGAARTARRRALSARHHHRLLHYRRSRGRRLRHVLGGTRPVAAPRHHARAVYPRANRADDTRRDAAGARG